MNATIQLKNLNSSATIYNGELISLIINKDELIHNKEQPGWNASDIEMFPIIGPTKLNNYKVNTKNGDAIQDQHGLLRELNYQLVSNDSTSVIFEINYKKNTFINNSKYPNKSSVEYLYWPYNFVFRKIISLTKNHLNIDFEITTDTNMPYMLGYHPAFKLSGLSNEIIKFKENQISLNEVLKGGSTAYHIANENEIILVKSTGNNIKISTKNFDNFMLWTEVNNMICIEPITQYPSLETQKYSEENMRITSKKDLFSVTISAL